MGILKIVEAFGSNYEIGFKVGKETKYEIRRVLNEIKYVNLSENEFIKNKYQEFYNIVENEFPQFLEELKGMAKGAGVEFRRLMKLNLPELEKFYNKKERDEEKCSTIVIKQNDKCVLVHNEDGQDNSDIFLIRCILPSNRKVISVCYYGKLLGFSATLNSNGLFIVNDSLSCIDEQVGLPKVFILRKLLEFDEIYQCIDYLKNNKRASGQNYLLIKGERSFSVEASATSFFVAEIKNKYFHTNNYVSPSMIKFEKKNNRKIGTFVRYQEIKNNIDMINSIDSAIKLFSSHKNSPSSLCSHGKERSDINKTLGVIVYDSSKEELMVGFGFTCKAVLKRYLL